MKRKYGLRKSQKTGESSAPFFPCILPMVCFPLHLRCKFAIILLLYRSEAKNPRGDQKRCTMKFFSLENPVWKFIGNLADFFILSCLWYLCSLPVVTAGAAASAVYYVTLKMSRDQEGELVRSFFKSFRQNLKPGCLLGVGYLAAAVVLGLDIVICLQQSSVLAGAMFFTSAVLLACAALFATMTFPLLARCDNTPGALFKMGVALTLRNLLPVLSALVVNVAFFAVGIFVFWPVLLVAPGLAAYCNAFIFNRIFDKYGLSL